MLKTWLSSSNISSAAIGLSVSFHRGYLNSSSSHSTNRDSLLSNNIVSLSFFRELPPSVMPRFGRSCRRLCHPVRVSCPSHHCTEKPIYQNTPLDARESLQGHQPNVTTGRSLDEERRRRLR